MGLTCRIVRLQRKRLIGLPKVLLGGGYYGERYRNLSWVGFLVFIWTVTIGFVTAYSKRKLILFTQIPLYDTIII